MCIRDRGQPAAAVLGARAGASVRRNPHRTVCRRLPVRHTGAVPSPQKEIKKLYLIFIFLLDSPSTLCYNEYRADEFGAIKNAAVAHLVERHLAKVCLLYTSRCV